MDYNIIAEYEDYCVAFLSFPFGAFLPFFLFFLFHFSFFSLRGGGLLGFYACFWAFLPFPFFFLFHFSFFSLRGGGLLSPFVFLFPTLRSFRFLLFLPLFPLKMGRKMTASGWCPRYNTPLLHVERELITTWHETNGIEVRDKRLRGRILVVSL